MRADSFSLRAPAETPVFQLKTEELPAIPAKEFLSRANAYVDAAKEDISAGHDDVLEYLKRKHPAPAPTPKPAAASSLPARFKREPQIFLGNMRFGRTRLFLSKFIGDLAWRGVRL